MLTKWRKDHHNYGWRTVEGFEVGGPSLKDPVAWGADVNRISQVGVNARFILVIETYCLSCDSDPDWNKRKSCSCFQALRALRKSRFALAMIPYQGCGIVRFSRCFPLFPCSSVMPLQHWPRSSNLVFYAWGIPWVEWFLTSFMHGRTDVFHYSSIVTGLFDAKGKFIFLRITL